MRSPFKVARPPGRRAARSRPDGSLMYSPPGPFLRYTSNPPQLFPRFAASARSGFALRVESASRAR